MPPAFASPPLEAPLDGRPAGQPLVFFRAVAIAVRRSPDRRRRLLAADLFSPADPSSPFIITRLVLLMVGDLCCSSSMRREAC